ncbi:MAG: DUF3536 domain-containing protein [Acidobacteria bacterium]|nr:DUF3536 domain-containing protein [Acidobacteriota bacterium]
MERYICIHGHFYQPPRENPWLEAIELQDSAYPYHDWNERITAECYAVNAVSRILDGEGKIAQIVNNYSRISFNFGPTLLAWLESKAPKTYQAILDADKLSQQQCSGHGSALAQPYNHMILPLATRRDRHTQVCWGIEDFQYRFGRRPEGMWLPETAADLATLEVLAEQRIRFTILAPHQALRVRRIGQRDWQDVTGGHIDPTVAYLAPLPSGKKIVLFFYDGPVSRAVAFERLLANGEHFAQRLLGAFSDEREFPQLVHIATDGETYGHHFWRGEMGLAYALSYIETNKLARLTNYGEFLERHPPTHEVEIVENTSWSCSHGIERWRSDCGCNSGGHPGWKQDWRTPLRQSLDWLRDTLAPAYEREARRFFRRPWKARDEYIRVILDRSAASLDRFLDTHAAASLDGTARTTAVKLLELQRHAMLMYTSCGWFFDDLSGIETVQVVQYAGRALQLAEELLSDEREEQFLKRLEQAKSNVPEHRDGRHIYEKFVRPARIDLHKLCAHYGISSLFEDYPERGNIYCYTVELQDYQSFEVQPARLAVGRARFTSEVTQQSSTLTFGVLYFGDHNVTGGVREFRGEEPYGAVIRELADAFLMSDFPQLVRLLDKHFGECTYSIRSLFRDEQRKVLQRMLASGLSRAEAHYRQIYERRGPLMRFLIDLGIPLPRAFQSAAELTINRDLVQAFGNEKSNLQRIGNLLNEARTMKVALDTATLEYALRKTLERIMKRLCDNPSDLVLLQRLAAAVELAGSLPFEVNLWEVQNAYFEILQSRHDALLARSERGDQKATQWIERFAALGERLGMRVPAIRTDRK